MNRPQKSLMVLAVCIGMGAATGEAQEKARKKPAAGDDTTAGAAAAMAGRDEAVNLYAARSQLKKAVDLLALGEKDRGVKMLEKIVQDFPDSVVRYEAWLAMGRHYLDNRDQLKAIAVLRHLGELKKPGEEIGGANREIYLEGLYLTGMAYFQMKQYGSAFPILRKITVSYPNTVWANQSYYYVGMCHFAQGNWTKAVEALSLVGTFIDPNAEGTRYVEAGRRFYVKIEDADLPIIHRLGREVSVLVETTHGDKETVKLVPLSLNQGVFLCSIPTEIGKPAPGDGKLQTIGGDVVTVTYADDNTKEGDRNTLRKVKVEIVSTAAVTYTMGTYESQAPAAFIGQPLHIHVMDVDQDVTDAADSLTVKVISRYKSEEESSAAEGMTGDLTFQEEQKYRTRDEVTLKLTEMGDGNSIHTGRFVGAVNLDLYQEGVAVNTNDKVLTCAIGDDVVTSYVDEVHIGGRNTRVVQAAIKVAGKITSPLSSSVNVVPDAVLKAKKNLVEATAFLELAKIFQSMGLRKGAKQKAAEGIDRTDNVIKTDTPIPSDLKEEAFKLRWDLYIVQEDYDNAIATCQLFNKLFPDSPFVDQAMMGIGNIHYKRKSYAEAMKVFRQVLGLTTSLAKAEAQFMIARTIETQAEEAAALAAAKTGAQPAPNAGLTETAIREYKLCAEKYPESQYAGEALGKLVDFYLNTRDYPRADDLLEQVFQDYPDAGFLDVMLLKWVYVAYRTGNVQKANDKCQQLIFEYPSSPHATKAKQLQPAILAELDKAKGGTGTTTAPAAGTGTERKANDTGTEE
jgi:TolA-binding protein